jgi:spore coat protein U-like protein
MRYKFSGFYVAVSSYFMLSGSMMAGTATANMGVSALVANTCTIAVPTNVSFGTVSGVFTTAINAPTSGSINIQCTNGDNYTITIGAGLNANSNYRQMVFTSGGTTYNIEYVLYSDSGYSIKWGNNTTPFGNAVSSTGTGAVQPYTVYAQIPTQNLTTPPIAGSYTDTVVVTINY